MNTLHTLTIEQFRKRNSRFGLCYQNHLLITDFIENLEPFMAPCRIDAIAVLVCIGGEVECSINLKHYRVSSNMILVNFPDDIIQIHRAESLEAYAVLISSELLGELNIDFKQRSDFYLNIRRKAVCLLPHAEVVTLKPYYALLSGHISRQRAETPQIIRGLVQAFSYNVISLMRLFQQQEEGEENDSMKRNKQLFQQFMALLKLHHATARGVKFYADKLCLTPNYLSGAIKDYTGKTVTEWVNDYVILEAKIMLKDANLSIQEISYRLNFPTQSAFGKYFKQQTGIGPKAYRNDQSEGNSTDS